jgi:integrase/recombinase XerD
VARARLSSKITPHTLRHAAATHMLKNGAPIRYLQEFLGHASVETTQVYTRITITDLKAIHAKYHPREKQEE